MILVDTSVWVDFLHKGDPHLRELLLHSKVATHPLVLGELACGSIQNRHNILSLLSDLHQAREASHDDVLHFISTHKLFGKGVGIVDMHLLCSAIISNFQFWSKDKRLTAVSKKFKVAFERF